MTGNNRKVWVKEIVEQLNGTLYDFLSVEAV
jgi:hypothetical protein